MKAFLAFRISGARLLALDANKEMLTSKLAVIRRTLCYGNG
ncbi:hypothetical protein [Bacillus sp. OV322]|nr:hypothetical protein [Bacillus sp. OV322]